jgi:hypothetical protein
MRLALLDRGWNLEDGVDVRFQKGTARTLNPILAAHCDKVDGGRGRKRPGLRSCALCAVGSGICNRIYVAKDIRYGFKNSSLQWWVRQS